MNEIQGRIDSQYHFVTSFVYLLAGVLGATTVWILMFFNDSVWLILLWLYFVWISYRAGKRLHASIALRELIAFKGRYAYGGSN